MFPKTPFKLSCADVNGLTSAKMELSTVSPTDYELSIIEAILKKLSRHKWDSCSGGSSL